MLTIERLRNVLAYDPLTGIFTWINGPNDRLRAGLRAGRTIAKGYISIRLDGRAYLAHRLAWFYRFGTWPAHQIDHINGRPSDNRLENLREADNHQNSANRKVRSAHGVKGVKRTKSGRWEAKLQHKGQFYALGTFDTIEEAGAAYLAKAKEIHGEFARGS
ncbi:MAG TPA: HNH endonuclease [Pyrinomonadaceae bacterium]|nr:HNH endonuclease [Pyrinomonadaceae bacterium]